MIAAALESYADVIAWETLATEQKQRYQAAVALAESPPSCLVLPSTQENLSEIVAIAHQNQWRILPAGSGSKLAWGGLPKAVDLIVSTQKLNRIIDHAVGDLTVTVEAGVKLADLQHQLGQAHQFLPLDPAYPKQATLGGIIATADTGSWRQRYGGVRDLVIGISFIRSDGNIAKAGGRVVKNVAGYDLMKLFTGSYGTLGIISEITLRTYPTPEASGTLGLSGDREAIRQAAQILRNSALTPTAADLLSAAVVHRLEMGQGMGMLVRFQSVSPSVDEQLEKLTAIAHQLDLNTVRWQDTDEQKLWQKLNTLMCVPTSPTAVTCKVGILPTAAPALLSSLPPDAGFGIIHNSSGLGYLHLAGEEGLQPVTEARSRCEQHQGFLSVLSAPAAFKQHLDPWGYTGNALEIMQKLKQKFDPKNLLSPGRFVGRI